jgi:glycosyltransferase involved in cell wall biosynthesis
MRVVHALTPAPFGGLESVVAALASGMRRRGHDVTVVAGISGSRDSSPFLGALAGEGLQVHSLFVPGRRYLAERRAFLELFKSINPDVVHTHGYRADVLAASAARSLGIPTVSTSHGFTGGDLKNRIYQWLQVKSYHLCTAVVAVSQKMSGELQASGIPAKRITVIRNSRRARDDLLDRDSSRKQLGLPADKFVVGWVGRLSSEKGPDVMLAAATSLAEEGLLTSFIGDGDMVQALRQEAAAASLGTSVRFHGALPEAGR